MTRIREHCEKWRQRNIGNEANAFTLIELLIVVAIISILSSIAVPNFLEAQVRAKVARVKNDMRTMAVAVEMYRVDTNQLPLRRDMDGYGTATPVAWPYPPVIEKGKYISVLTTPIAYINNIPEDVFNTKMRLSPTNDNPTCAWIDYWDDVQTTNWIQVQKNDKSFLTHNNYVFTSVGPDGYMGLVTAYVGGRWGYPPEPSHVTLTSRYFYDSTNGTISTGNIHRWHKDLQQGDTMPKALPF